MQTINYAAELFNYEQTLSASKSTMGQNAHFILRVIPWSGTKKNCDATTWFSNKISQMDCKEFIQKNNTCKKAFTDIIHIIFNEQGVGKLHMTVCMAYLIQVYFLISKSIPSRIILGYLDWTSFISQHIKCTFLTECALEKRPWFLSRLFHSSNS